ncbi:MAG: hypothetical protein IT367_10010, partial [Candidatus Hydrogenedentes bacterium]|nr:hypothetical protein [Candidatus Hydrogenedentota bacterium]
MPAIVRVFVLAVCAMVAVAQEPPAAQPVPSPDTTTATPPAVTPASPAVPMVEPAQEPEKTDPAAQMFMLKCAGCHTIGGGQLSGPDLLPVQTWPRQNVDPAIQRMEKNVGPLKPEDIALLADFLQAPDAAGRLADERKRIALTELAKLEPANAKAGEAIFFGHTPLTNRGLSCASCHAVSGRGGNLASDLTGSFTKMGEVPLGSAIEGVTFPLMKAAYADNAITKQETIHLVKYLESAGKQAGEPARVPPLHAIGSVGAVIALVGLTQHFRKRNRGVRAALVRNAM